MVLYCSVCCKEFEGNRCPDCGRKSTRAAEPDDLFFLTEQEQIWSGMLADVLMQAQIPFIQKSVLGAGLALRVGPILDRERFYVFKKQLPEAQEIVEELFSKSFETDGSGEDDERTLTADEDMTVEADDERTMLLDH